MHRRFLSLALTGFLCIVIFNWSCTKLDTTNLGSDLIPVVDNVNTFADTLHVDASQFDYDDTTYITFSSDHILGNISGSYDPMFGKTTANIYFQLKPPNFPFTFGNKDSIIALDSVVLCLLYKGIYGDSNVVQQLQAVEVIDDSFKFSSAKFWRTDMQPLTGGPISPTVNVDVRALGNYMKYTNGRDSVKNQIRIPLNNPYASSLFTSSSDSFSIGSGNHALYNDSIYKRLFNGIAVKPVGPGAGLIYTNLADTNTKLEFHYRIKNGGKIDTVYRSFTLQTLGDIKTISKTANFISRDRSGTPSATPGPDVLYLQGQPGTYASLSIPGLDTFKNTNRIIHRAELIIEQVPTDPINDVTFAPPNYLYLDLKDTGTSVPVRYKPIYLDLNTSEFYDPDNSLGFYPTTVDFSYFGGFIRKKTGPGSSFINYYDINISRYIQQLVKNHGTNYKFRLFPAYSIHYPQYFAYRDYYNSIAYGRVKVGSGSNTAYPMRLRIIYSKLK